MALRIATNINALTVSKNVRELYRKNHGELEKLSSGKRVMRTVDGAADKAKIEHFRAYVRGFRQAARNAADGVSVIQIAEGCLDEISNILIRLRQLTVQSASDTVGDEERGYLDIEYQQLVQEIDHISESTKLNNTQLRDDSSSGVLRFHVGPTAGEAHKIEFDIDSTNANVDNIGINGTGISDKSDALDSMESIDGAIDRVSSMRAKAGAIQSRMLHAINNLETHVINHDNARSVIEDVDVAASTSALAVNQILTKSAIAVLAQSHNIPKYALKLIK